MGPVSFQAVYFMFRLYMYLKIRDIPKMYVCSCCSNLFSFAYDILALPFNELSLFTFHSNHLLVNHLFAIHLVYEDQEHIETDTKFCFRNFLKTKWEKYYYFHLDPAPLYWTPERIKQYNLLHEYLVEHQKPEITLHDSESGESSFTINNSEEVVDSGEYVFIERRDESKRYITEL